MPDQDSQQKIFEVQYFCMTNYFCRQQLISGYYAWDGDPPSQVCGRCDNCTRCIEHNVQDLPDATDDVYELLEVTKSLTSQYTNITPTDIINVYTHAKTKDMEYKGYLTSEAYKRVYTRKGSSVERTCITSTSRPGCFWLRQASLYSEKSKGTSGGVQHLCSWCQRNRSWVYRAPRRQRRERN